MHRCLANHFANFVCSATFSRQIVFVSGDCDPDYIAMAPMKSTMKVMKGKFAGNVKAMKSMKKKEVKAMKAMKKKRDEEDESDEDMESSEDCLHK